MACTCRGLDARSASNSNSYGYGDMVYATCTTSRITTSLQNGVGNLVGDISVDQWDKLTIWSSPEPDATVITYLDSDCSPDFAYDLFHYAADDPNFCLVVVFLKSTVTLQNKQAV